jgi:hypothetical protein
MLPTLKTVTLEDTLMAFSLPRLASRQIVAGEHPSKPHAVSSRTPALLGNLSNPSMDLGV